MTRRRWIYPPNGEPVEVSEDYVLSPRNVDGSVLWNDRAYQDMGDHRFSSRSQHRQYMKERGLTTTDDFLGNYWKDKEAKRIEQMSGVDPSRKQDIVQAIHKLKRR